MSSFIIATVNTFYNFSWVDSHAGTWHALCNFSHGSWELIDQERLGAHLPSAANIAVCTEQTNHAATTEKGQFSQGVILLYVAESSLPVFPKTGLQWMCLCAVTPFQQEFWGHMSLTHKVPHFFAHILFFMLPSEVFVENLLCLLV